MTVVNCVGWWEAEKSITGGGTSDTVATHNDFFFRLVDTQKARHFLLVKKGDSGGRTGHRDSGTPKSWKGRIPLLFGAVVN